MDVGADGYPKPGFLKFGPSSKDFSGPSNAVPGRVAIAESNSGGLTAAARRPNMPQNGPANFYIQYSYKLYTAINDSYNQQHSHDEHVASNPS